MSHLTIQQILTVFLTVTLRLSGLLLFAPFFGSAVIPARVKAGLALACTLLLYPLVSDRLTAVDLSQWPMLVFTELLIGAAVGITASLVFDAVQMAGQVVSVQVGYSLISILDPQTQSESTVIATFHQTVAMLIFLRIGVPLYLLRVVARSFDYLPPQMGHLNPAFVTTIVHAGASVFILGVQLAAPVLSATLLADFALGLLGKASAQLPLMLLGPAVKSILGLLILAATLRYWPDMFARLFLNSVASAEHLLALAR